MVYCSLRRIGNIVRLYFNPYQNLEKLYVKERILDSSVSGEVIEKVIDYFAKTFRSLGYRKKCIRGSGEEPPDLRMELDVLVLGTL